MSRSAPRAEFEAFLADVLADAESKTAFEDAVSRNRIVDALVRMRKRAHRTQTQVAKAMGVKQPTISGFETEDSDPRLSTILRYARAVDAVFVWDVKPRLEARGDENYVDQGRGVTSTVNLQEPSRRALSWRPNSVYQDIDSGAPLNAVAHGS